MPRKPEQYEEIREKSREKILAAALELFANNGYDASSIDSIAKKAGISKGLIYNYYKSKKDILLAIMNDAMKLGEVMMAENKAIKDPYKKMRKMVDSVFDMMYKQPEYMKLLTVLSLQPGVMAETREFTKNAYKKGVEWSGEITGHRGKKALIEMLMIGALLDGIALNFILHGNRYPMEELRKQIIKQYCTPKMENK